LLDARCAEDVENRVAQPLVQRRSALAGVTGPESLRRGHVGALGDLLAARSVAPLALAQRQPDRIARRHADRVHGAGRRLVLDLEWLFRPADHLIGDLAIL